MQRWPEIRAHEFAVALSYIPLVKGLTLLDKRVEAIVAVVDNSVMETGLPCFPVDEFTLPVPLSQLEQNNVNHQAWLGINPIVKE